MKFPRKILALSAAAGLALTTTVAQAGDALDRIMDRKVLKVATDANWAPQSFINDDNEMDGFDVAVAREIGKRLGVEVEFVTPEWSIITAGNWHGRWDLSVGSMTPTKQRAEVLSFPAIYYYTPASFVVHKDSGAAGLGGLNGKKIGATTASVYELYLQKDLVIDAVGVPKFDYKVEPGEIRSYKDSTTALDDLRLGDSVRLDGVIGALPAMNQAIKNGYPIKVVGNPVFFEPLAVAIDKGDEEFAAKLAAIVTDMHKDGTLSKLSTKWYGTDYTSQK